MNKCVDIGTPAVEPLIAALKDSDKDVRQAAVEVLDRLGWQPGKDENGALYWILKRELNKCADIGTPAVEPLIAALKDSDKDVRQAAAEALEKIGTCTVEPLIAALKDSDKDVRQAAAEALGKIGDIRAVEPLVAALKDGNSFPRKAAAQALEAMNWQPTDASQHVLHAIAMEKEDAVIAEGPAVIQGLITIIKTGDRHAAYLLAKIGGPAFEPLISALKDENSNLREGAAMALGQLGDTRAVTPLITLLKDEEMRVRMEAAWALGGLRDARAVKPLIALYEEEVDRCTEPDVMRSVIWAFGEIGDKRAVPSLERATYLSWTNDSAKSALDKIYGRASHAS